MGLLTKVFFLIYTNQKKHNMCIIYEYFSYKVKKYDTTPLPKSSHPTLLIDEFGGSHLRFLKESPGVRRSTGHNHNFYSMKQNCCDRIFRQKNQYEKPIKGFTRAEKKLLKNIYCCLVIYCFLFIKLSCNLFVKSISLKNSRISKAL